MHRLKIDPLVCSTSAVLAGPCECPAHLIVRAFEKMEAEIDAERRENVRLRRFIDNIDSDLHGMGKLRKSQILTHVRMVRRKIEARRG